jgi:PncC family amidohydrolase
MATLSEEIGNLLRSGGLTLGTIESATGGLIANLITDVPGSSDYFKGSLVAYANEIKTGITGVDANLIERYGAVSPQVAEAMAAGGLQILRVDICLADTGIAGPGGATPEKPVGLFYLGLASRDKVQHRKHLFNGNRAENKQAAAQTALEWLREYLTGLDS